MRQVMKRQIVDDQMHINTAYAHVREAMNELLQIRHLDSALVKVLGDVQHDEDVLYQYVTSKKGA